MGSGGKKSHATFALLLWAGMHLKGEHRLEDTSGFLQILDRIPPDCSVTKQGRAVPDDKWLDWVVTG